MNTNETHYIDLYDRFILKVVTNAWSTIWSWFWKHKNVWNCSVTQAWMSPWSIFQVFSQYLKVSFTFPVSDLPPWFQEWRYNAF